MFEAFNVKDFYIWHHAHIWGEWPEEHLNALFNNFKVLDKSKIKDRPIWDLWKYETVSKEDRHPGIEGHKQLADYIYASMKDHGFGG